jgi:hypothetical protein
MTDDEYLDLRHTWEIRRRASGELLLLVGPCTLAEAYWTADHLIETFPEAWTLSLTSCSK